MRGPHVVARRVRIGAGDDVHAERSGSRRRARRTGSDVAEPGAAVMQRHLGRVIGDDAAGAERGGVGVQALEVVEPELRIEAPRIVLDERQLHPAHRPIEPAGGNFRGQQRLRNFDGIGKTQPHRRRRTGTGRDLQKIPARKHDQILLEGAHRERAPGTL